jgi:hypothetical protein
MMAGAPRSLSVTAQTPGAGLLTVTTISPSQGSLDLSNMRFQATAKEVQVDRALTLRSFEARSDAGGALKLGGSGAGQTVTLVENQSLSGSQRSPALLLEAVGKIEVMSTLFFQGSSGDAVIRPINGAQPMYVGSGIFTPTGLHVDLKDGFKETMDGFGRLILGSSAQTGDLYIGERVGARAGHVFADPLELHVAQNVARPVTVFVQGNIQGESLKVGVGGNDFSLTAGGRFQSLRSDLRFDQAQGVQFLSEVRVGANTTIEADAIEFDGARVTGVSSGPVPLLSLRPVSDTTITLGGSGAAPAGTLLLDNASLLALGNDDGLRFDLDVGHKATGKGTVSVAGSVAIRGALGLYGKTLTMTPQSSVAGLMVDLRFDGAVDLAKVRADHANVQSVGGKIRSVLSAAGEVNLASRTEGVLSSLVLYGKGAAMGSSDRPVRAQANEVWVTLPGGKVQTVRGSDGTEQYLGVDGQGVYRQVVVTQGRGSAVSSLLESSSDRWVTQPVVMSAAQKSLFSFGAAVGAGSQAAVDQKSLNSATRAYLEGGSRDYEWLSVASGLSSVDEASSPLDTLFDPLEADRQGGETVLLEHAWLLGSSSYLPDVLGVDSVGGGNYQTWSEDELEI